MPRAPAFAGALLRKVSEIALDIVGIEGAAVEEAIAAEHQAALHRSRPDRLAEAAFAFRTGAGEGSRRACERSPVNVGAEHARRRRRVAFGIAAARSEEHTSALQSLQSSSSAIFGLKKKKT